MAAHRISGHSAAKLSAAIWRACGSFCLAVPSLLALTLPSAAAGGLLPQQPHPSARGGDFGCGMRACNGADGRDLRHRGLGIIGQNPFQAARHRATPADRAAAGGGAATSSLYPACGDHVICLGRQAQLPCSSPKIARSFSFP